jgi:hypothetical protein
MRNKENPMSLIFNTDDTWNYRAELLTAGITMKLFSYFISLIFRRLLEVWYAREFRHFRV